MAEGIHKAIQAENRRLTREEIRQIVQVRRSESAISDAGSIDVEVEKIIDADNKRLARSPNEKSILWQHATKEQKDEASKIRQGAIQEDRGFTCEELMRLIELEESIAEQQ